VPSVIEGISSKIPVARGYYCETTQQLLDAYRALRVKNAVLKPVFGAAGAASMPHAKSRCCPVLTSVECPLRARSERATVACSYEHYRAHYGTTECTESLECAATSRSGTVTDHVLLSLLFDSAGEGILFVHDEQELALYDWPMVSSSNSSSSSVMCAKRGSTFERAHNRL
jgi:hypothetical protein